MSLATQESKTQEFDMDTEVQLVYVMACKEPKKQKYSELYDYLTKTYNKNIRQTGRTAFEYFNADKIKVKPHIDYEEYYPMDNFSFNAVEESKNNIMLVLCELFNTKPEEWATSNDTRMIMKREKVKGKKIKEIPKMKASFHFVLSNKRCDINTLGLFIKENMYKFRELQLESGIDTKIYRNGWNKFRMPMTKKSKEDKNSLLVPDNFETKEEYHKHLVSITDYCDDIHLKVGNLNDVVYQETSVEKINKQLIMDTMNANQEIESIITNYTTMGEKDGSGDAINCVLYDIREFECGELHDNNHNYLIWNKNTNTLKVRCHSERCQNFEKVLFKPKVPTLHFDVNFLNHMPIQMDRSDNYNEVKQYFENFFVYIRDTNSYYRLGYEYNEKYNYYERQIKGVNIDGYKKDLYYTEFKQAKGGDNEEIDPETGEVLKTDTATKLVNFYKRYEVDMNKMSYSNLSFQPYGCLSSMQKINNGDFNLFTGFNYQTVLNHNEKLNIPDEKKEDFEFLLNHIKNYVCGYKRAKQSGDKDQIKLAKKSFWYLISYLANIIQEPTRVPHIILVLYSKIHGTGKSGFTKFISNVIGPSFSYFGSFEQILDTHSHAHVAKLINIIEEVDRFTTRKYHNTIKDFSQRESAIYNEKNKPQHKIKTYIRYMMTTNYSDGVFFDSEDRRIVVYTFDKVRDMDYIHRLQQIMEDPYTIYQFGKFLEDHEIPFKRNNDWEHNRPLTEDYFSMRSEDPVDQFLKDLLKMESIDLDYLDPNEYYPSLNWNGTDNCIGIVKDAFYKKMFIKFFDENNCFQKKFRAKAYFLNYLKTTFKGEIGIKKLKGIKKEYIVIDLEKLWKKYFSEEEFKNHHNVDKSNDEEDSDSDSEDDSDDDEKEE